MSELKPELSGVTLAQRLPIALFLLRASLFLVFLVWVIDKFVNPAHSARVLETFYGLGGVGNSVFYVLGVLQLLVVLAFIAGFMKTWSYGIVLIMHGLSTLVSFRQYLAPFEGSNLLFYAGWPMLAACFVLFYLRDFDTWWTISQ